MQGIYIPKEQNILWLILSCILLSRKVNIRIHSSLHVEHTNTVSLSVFVSVCLSLIFLLSFQGYQIHTAWFDSSLHCVQMFHNNFSIQCLIVSQAIAIAGCFLNEGSILIVCPAILRYSWAEELERWYPNIVPSDIHLGMDI